MKKPVLVAVAALLIGGGAFAGSPYLAASNLKAAAVSGDADQIEANVDFAIGTDDKWHHLAYFFFPRQRHIKSQ